MMGHIQEMLGRDMWALLRSGRDMRALRRSGGGRLALLRSSRDGGLTIMMVMTTAVMMIAMMRVAGPVVRRISARTGIRPCTRAPPRSRRPRDLKRATT